MRKRYIKGSDDVFKEFTSFFLLNVIEMHLKAELIVKDKNYTNL